jgi:N4-gp56 family major capsid protein
MAAINPPNTGASLEALDANGLRLLWRAKVAKMEAEHDFFQELEGTRADSLIETVNDTSVGAGHSIKFTAVKGFHQEGKHGDEGFDAASDYETIATKTNSLVVDWVRNGTAINLRAEGHMGLRHELSNKIPEMLGEWEGRKKDRAAWMAFLRKGGTRNYAIAGGGTDVNGITGSNALSWDDIVEVGALLSNHGAQPAMLGKIGKNPVRRYVVAASKTGLLSLKKDEAYLAAVRAEATAAGKANVLFTGGYADVDGHLIMEKQIIDHDGDGPLGGPIAPKLKLSAAINAPSASFTVTGGSNTKVNYTQDFPNNAFKWNASDVGTTGTDPFYLLVVNPPNAATDPGKMGFYKCVGNTGAAITVTEALSGATPGSFVKNTVGLVTWDTGVWSGKHTTNHPAGAMAYLANAKGQPLGRTVFMGACAMRRGYGEYRNHRATDTDEGGFIKQTFIWTVFGQSPKQNADDTMSNFMVLTHAIHIPGTPIPTNIT